MCTEESDKEKSKESSLPLLMHNVNMINDPVCFSCISRDVVRSPVTIYTTMFRCCRWLWRVNDGWLNEALNWGSEQAKKWSKSWVKTLSKSVPDVHHCLYFGVLYFGCLYECIKPYQTVYILYSNVVFAFHFLFYFPFIPPQHYSLHTTF